MVSNVLATLLPVLLAPPYIRSCYAAASFLALTYVHARLLLVLLHLHTYVHATLLPVLFPFHTYVHATLLQVFLHLHMFMLGCCQSSCTSVHTFMLRCCHVCFSSMCTFSRCQLFALTYVHATLLAFFFGVHLFMLGAASNFSTSIHTIMLRCCHVLFPFHAYVQPLPVLLHLHTFMPCCWQFSCTSIHTFMLRLEPSSRQLLL